MNPSAVQKNIILQMFILLGAFFLIVSCKKPELTVWSSYPELADFFETAGKSYGKLTVKICVPETDNINSLSSGFIVLSWDKAEALITEGYAMDLSVLDLSKLQNRGWQFYFHDSRPYAVFLNAGTGVLCYDPELMERYLYISSPAGAQKQFEDLNQFIVSAFLVGERSASDCAVLPAIEEIRPSFAAVSREKMNLNLQQAEKWYNDIAYIFRDRRWEGTVQKDGTPRRTLAFFLKANAPFSAPHGSFAGKAWQIIRGPDPESNGGLWLVLGKNIPAGKKRIAARSLEYLDVLLKSNIRGKK